MKPFVHEIADLDPLQAYSAVRSLPYSLLLDSADPSHPGSRYSFVMAYPIETVETKNGKTMITNWDQRLTLPGDPFAILRERMEAWIQKARTVPNLPPFQGGAAGYFGYDLGRFIETLPETAQDNPEIPDMAVGLYDQVYAYDHKQNKGWVITHAKNQKEAERKREFFLAQLTREQPDPTYSPLGLKWTSNIHQTEYLKKIKQVIEYIYAGDIFQANIAQRFAATLPENYDSFGHYIVLREINPAPFACYMNLGKVKISSASPERFLNVNSRREVVTMPIKGTRPHVADPQQDRLYREELLNSEKDRAENIMIVDLLRNDLSKVCQPDSISAHNLCQLETFASVHHLVSTVRGSLKKERDALDLLRACFPGGSITGAPKIRAMEIIEEMEPTRRGPYCGSMAYIGFDGQMDSNILIRTLVYDGNSVTFQTGGGIVADSDPGAEYQETLDKARALFRSFEAGLEQPKTASKGG
ncbi:MAG: aminodeoxychorismate synthase component I [Alphaproteobacteria bacterium]|nr:aminodeoxychorismate synthase component I [Alphaproteobacteria bacterium]